MIVMGVGVMVGLIGLGLWRSDPGAVAVVLLLVGGCAIYFLPLIIAAMRKHRNLTAIGLLNLLAGWTVVAWIVALIWAVYRSPHDTD